ncbi:MAG: ribonuclease III [Bacteroidaceae bacterium]|nr:ribonuclease III [Bacteroidaceae bacterium]
MKLPFQSERELRVSLYSILGFYPHDIRLYKQALRHKSLNTSGGGKRDDNERLEFLGDAILDAAVGDIVYRHFCKAGEGFLTNTRSKIVQRASLNRLAKEVGLDRLVSSRDASGNHNSYLGGNAFEALVGAIYLDRGYDTVMHFLRHRVLRQLINIEDVARVEVNFKSKLIEWCQKHKLQLVFDVRSDFQSGNSSPVFVCCVVIEGIECESGRGYSKKESHQRASQATLACIKRDSRLVRAFFEAKERREAAPAPGESASAEPEPVGDTPFGET